MIKYKNVSISKTLTLVSHKQLYPNTDVHTEHSFVV